MLFVPYYLASTPNTWSCYGINYQATAFIYKCQGWPPGVPSNYYPLSDLATIAIYYPQTVNPPQFVIYIASHASPLISPTSYQKIYKDHGSGLSTDYAGFWTTPLGIGSYSASDDNADQPDYAHLCKLFDSSFMFPLNLVLVYGMTQEVERIKMGKFCSHPQFGDFGIYLIERSHSRPDQDTVNSMSTLALSGQGEFNQ